MIDSIGKKVFLIISPYLDSDNESPLSLNILHSFMVQLSILIRHEIEESFLLGFSLDQRYLEELAVI